MLYEILYEAVDGKFVAMRDRFKTEVVPCLPRHRVEFIGVFEAPDEDGRLTYLSRFKSEQTGASAWAAFGAGPEWRLDEARTDAHGPLLKSQTVSVLTPAVVGLLPGGFPSAPR